MAELQPTVEDCYSDDSEGGSIPFQGRRSPNAANVSTKRSHPSDLDKQMPPAQERAPTNIDLRSDSGYSSYTTATVSSTNSAQSAPPQRSPPQVPAAAAPAPPQPEAPKARRRPTDQTEKTSKSSSSSRPKPSARTASSKTPAIVQQQPPERKRRPTVTQESRPERRDRRDSRVEPDGAEPRRTKYDPNAPASAVRRRPDILPSQSARDVRPIPQDTRSMHSDPASYQQAPPSPTHYRQSYHAGAAVIQPATTRPRRPSAATRPMSYSGEPGAQYHHWAHGGPGYPPQHLEHGPPLSQSAQFRQPYPQMAHPSMPYGTSPGYPPHYLQQMPQSYDAMQRPGMVPRQSFNTARTAPQAAVIQAPRDQQQYSTRRNHPQGTYPNQLQIQDEAYTSEGESETGSSDGEDDYEPEPEINPEDPRARRALMPPPPSKLSRTKSKSKTKPKKTERPPLPHAHTITTVEQVRNHRHSVSTPVVVDDRPRHRSTKSTNEPSRRASVSRPPPPAHTQTEYPARRGSVYVGDSTKAERRRSAHYGHSAQEKAYAEYALVRREETRLAAEEQARQEEKAARRQRKAEKQLLEDRFQAEQAARAEKERKREKRNSKVYYQPPAAFDDSESEYESDEPVAPVVPEAPIAPRRRPTDAGGRRPKEVQAIDYMNNQRGTDAPLNDHIHRAAKRASRVPSMPSHSGSSGSDRQSQSNRTAVTSNGNNEIRLRVDANAPLSLQFNGDMEGRTMQLIPTEDGMAELVISGSRDNESNYHSSERGSNAGDGQALVTRSQLEEMTKASMRSDRRRRESRPVRDPYDDRIVEVQRPLRRRANTSSYYN
ncbi:uncharacterized protein J4E78_000487 [Alternaria triticimaculans]|uniref:uncharacterized protein n=1 Tax=Alternaria triticimaculans TaxID=297637 RepID=UPI0020C35405|nr:uncharacterized protein J4E78_000487 [Alternaria triticimaculans]KAI4671988.1 hypothetical protein J4E78_000487 [Alternaria triticimaculans]